MFPIYSQLAPMHSEAQSGNDWGSQLYNKMKTKCSHQRKTEGRKRIKIKKIEFAWSLVGYNVLFLKLFEDLNVLGPQLRNADW